MGVLVNLPSTRPVGGVHARLNAVYLNCLGSYALFARSSALPYGPNQIFSPSGSGISLSPLRYGTERGSACVPSEVRFSQLVTLNLVLILPLRKAGPKQTFLQYS